MVQYSSDEELLNRSWSSIEKKYRSNGRHYHTLQHIDHLIVMAERSKEHIHHYVSFVLSILYHDVIYKALRKDNEKKSADFMRVDLKRHSVPKDIIDRCYRQIMQTQKHQLTDESELDDALFLDLDLEVLSWPWDDYLNYTRQIRKEYWMYPSSMYFKGRRIAMQAFLNRPAIYFTEHFRTNYEAKARANLKRELAMI